MFVSGVVHHRGMEIREEETRKVSLTRCSHLHGVFQEDDDDDAVRSANRAAFLSDLRLRFVWLVRIKVECTFFILIRPSVQKIHPSRPDQTRPDHAGEKIRLVVFSFVALTRR